MCVCINMHMLTHVFILVYRSNLFFTIVYYLIYLFTYLFIFWAALGLCCCVRAFSSCRERGLLFVAVHGLLIVVASLVVEHGL